MAMNPTMAQTGARQMAQRGPGGNSQMALQQAQSNMLRNGASGNPGGMSGAPSVMPAPAPTPMPFPGFGQMPAPAPTPPTGVGAPLAGSGFSDPLQPDTSRLMPMLPTSGMTTKPPPTSPAVEQYSLMSEPLLQPGGPATGGIAPQPLRPMPPQPMPQPGPGNSDFGHSQQRMRQTQNQLNRYQRTRNRRPGG